MSGRQLLKLSPLMKWDRIPTKGNLLADELSQASEELIGVVSTALQNQLLLGATDELGRGGQLKTE